MAIKIVRASDVSAELRDALAAIAAAGLPLESLIDRVDRLGGSLALSMQQWRSGSGSGVGAPKIAEEVQKAIDALEKQAQTLGKNRAQMVIYDAEQLVMQQATKGNREQIERMSAALAAGVMTIDDVAEAAGAGTAQLLAQARATANAITANEASTKGNKELEKSYRDTAKAAAEYLERLEKEIETFGLSEDALRRYELAHTEGLTPAQRRQADAALDQVEANRKLKEVWDDAARAAQTLTQGNAELRERIAQQSDALAGLTPAQVALNAANREGALIEAQLALGKEGLTDAMREELKARIELINTYTQNEAAIDAQKELADEAKRASEEFSRAWQDEIRSFSQAAANGTDAVGDYFSNLWKRIKAELIQSGIINLIGMLFSGSGGGAGWTSMLGGMMGGGSGGGGLLGNFFSQGAMNAAGQNFGAGIAGAAPWLGAIAGGMYGLTQRGNGGSSSVAAGAAYGVGGWALGTVGYGAALGYGAAGAAGAMSGAMGAAAAVPVVGWIIAAIAAIDMITGGKVFGTKYRPESAEQSISIGASGGTASASMTEVRQRSLFRGRSWRTTSQDPGDDARAWADELYTSIYDAMTGAARSLAIDVPPVIDASIRTVTEYDKKGRITGLKIFTDALGRTWEEAISDPEDEAEIQAAAARAASRIQSEAIIATIDAALGTTVDAIVNPIIGGIGDGIDRAGPIIGDRIDDMIESMLKNTGTAGSGRQVGEASAIAERWRHDADMLAEGAQFLLLAASDIRRGAGLLADEGGLTAITALIEELAASGETLSDTYIRVATSAALLDQALAMSGVQIDGTREALVRLATDITTAAGGLERATALWSAYFGAYYTDQERALYALTQLQAQAAREFGDIGLNAGDYSGADGMAALRALFEARMPELSAEAMVHWLEALAALATVTEAQAAYNALLGETAETVRDAAGIAALLADLRWDDALAGMTDLDRELAEIGRQFAEHAASAAAMGATEAELAEIRELEERAAQRLIAADVAAELERIAAATETYRALVSGLRDELDAAGMSEFQIAMRDIARWTASTTDELHAAARAAGMQAAAEGDLALVHEVAAQRAAAAIAALRNAARSLVEQLQGTPLEQIDARIAAAQLASTSSQMDAIGEVDRAASEMWARQRQAIESITAWLDSQLLGDLSTLTPEQQLAEARSQFDSLAARAAAGDADALAEMTQMADLLLRMGQDYWSNNEQGVALEQYVRDIMRGLAGLDIGAQPVGSDAGASGAGGAGTGASAELDRLYAEREALLLQLEADRRMELAQQVAAMVRDLVAATGESLADVAASISLNIAGLVADLGVNLNDLTAETALALAGIAQSMGVDLTALAQSVGVDLGTLGDRQSLLNAALDAALGLLPDDIREQLLGPLDALRGAVTDIDQTDAMFELLGITDALPRGIRDMLAPYFDFIDPAPLVNELSTLRVIEQLTFQQLDIAREQADSLRGIYERIDAWAFGGSEGNVPAYAAGGWVNGPTHLLAGEAGRELILPNPVSEFFQRSGIPINASGGGSDNRELVAELRQLRADNREIAARNAELLERLERAEREGTDRTTDELRRTRDAVTAR